MKISVFGLGYVGTVSAACLARDGHEVLGVDPVDAKVDLINQGRSPIIEHDIGEIVAWAHQRGRLRATNDPIEAVGASEMSIVCVGTPSEPSGGTDYRFVHRVCGEIGAALASKADFHVVVARSTMLPGSTEAVVIPALEAGSGKRVGEGFGVCYHPEFLREGTAVADYDDPPKIVLGATDERSARKLASLYAHLDAPSAAPASPPRRWSSTSTTCGMRSRCASPTRSAPSPMPWRSTATRSWRSSVGTPSSTSRPSICGRASPSAARACPRTSGR